MEEILSLKQVVPDEQIKGRSCTTCDKKIESQAVRMKSCSHIYHRECLIEFLQNGKESACPKCRKPFYPKKFACERCKSRDVQFKLRPFDDQGGEMIVIGCRVCGRERVITE